MKNVRWIYCMSFLFLTLLSFKCAEDTGGADSKNQMDTNTETTSSQSTDSDNQPTAQGEDTSTGTNGSTAGNTGCSATVTPIEQFTAADAPETIAIAGQSYSVTSPWGYNRNDNTSRSYPIVVNGCWGEGWAFSDAVRQKYPAFYLEYQRCDSESDGANLAVILDAAVEQGLRIDMNRVYLTGFSKGGSGSYKLVRGYLSKNKLFAAVNRVAGQSETELPVEALEKTAIWLHIGTQDEPVRIQVTLDAYNYLKTHTLNQTATESTATDTLTGFPRTTKTLTKNDIEIVKYSVYDGMGHDPTAAYQDPHMFDWLFSQSLGCR